MFPFFLALYNGSQVSIVALWATCFYSVQIRTLVVMATYVFQRLKIEKVEIDNFFCLSGDVWNLIFTEMFIE